MAFILIAGLSGRTRDLGPGPACDYCGGPTERHRNDSMFSLFFIPLFPVKRGEEYCVCTRCGHILGANDMQRLGPQQSATATTIRCRNCGGATKQGYRYCPHCGSYQQGGGYGTTATG